MSSLVTSLVLAGSIIELDDDIYSEILDCFDYNDKDNPKEKVYTNYEDAKAEYEKAKADEKVIYAKIESWED